MESNPRISRTAETGGDTSVSHSSSVGQPTAAAALHHRAREPATAPSDTSANGYLVANPTNNNAQYAGPISSAVISNSAAAQRHMERVLFNLHHRLCTVVLLYTSKTMRQLMEGTLLLLAICGFGALIMLHVTFVYRGPSTINCSTKCLSSIPGFDPHQANITHIVLMEELPTRPSSWFPSTASAARGLFQAIISNGQDDGNNIKSHVVHIGGGNSSYSIQSSNKEQSCESTESMVFSATRPRRHTTVPSIQQIKLSYSPIKGYLLLPHLYGQPQYSSCTDSSSEDCVEFVDHRALQSILKTQYVMVSPRDPNCFGDSLLQAMIWNLVGSDTVMINWLRAALLSDDHSDGSSFSTTTTTTLFNGDREQVRKRNPAFMYNPRTQVMMELSSLTQRDYHQYHHDDHSNFRWKHWLDWLTTKCLVILQTCFLFFSTTTLVSFTLRETQERMVGFTQELSRCVRNQLPLSGLITTHVVHTLLFVPIMVGMVFFLSACYRYPLGSSSLKYNSEGGPAIGGSSRGNGFNGEDTKNASLLAFNVLSVVWVCEVFSVLSLRSWQGITFFPRIFFLLFCLFHIYHFAYGPYGFGNVAFGTVACFMLHSMLFFWHRYELPAVAFGWVTIDAPRMIMPPSFPANFSGVATLTQQTETAVSSNVSVVATAMDTLQPSVPTSEEGINSGPPLSPPTTTRTTTARGQIVPPIFPPSVNQDQGTAPTGATLASGIASSTSMTPIMRSSLQREEFQLLDSTTDLDTPAVSTISTTMPPSYPSFSSTASSTSSSRWFPFLVPSTGGTRRHEGSFDDNHDDSSHRSNPNGSNGSLVNLGGTSDGCVCVDDNEYAFFMGGEIVVQRRSRQLPPRHSTSDRQHDQQGVLNPSFGTTSTQDADLMAQSAIRHRKHNPSTPASKYHQEEERSQHQQLTPTVSNMRATAENASDACGSDQRAGSVGSSFTLPCGRPEEASGTLDLLRDVDPPSFRLLPQQAITTSSSRIAGDMSPVVRGIENNGVGGPPTSNKSRTTTPSSAYHENCYSEESSGLQAILEVRLHPRNPNRRNVTDTDGGGKAACELPPPSEFSLPHLRQRNLGTVLPPSVPQLLSSEEKNELETDMTSARHY